MGKCRICGKYAQDPYQLCVLCNTKEKERKMRAHGKRRCKKCSKLIPGDSTYCYDCNPYRKR